MITLQELRDALKPSAVDEHLLEPMRLQVIADFENRTKKLWNERTDHVLYFPVMKEAPDRDRDLLIRAVNVSSLVLSGWFITEDEADAETLDGYQGIDRGQVGYNITPTTRGAYWPHFVKATFDCGYSALPDKFAEIKQAMLIQLRYLRARNSDDRIAVSGQGMNQGSATFFLKAELHPFYESVVNRYVKK